MWIILIYFAIFMAAFLAIFWLFKFLQKRSHPGNRRQDLAIRWLAIVLTFIVFLICLYNYLATVPGTVDFVIIAVSMITFFVMWLSSAAVFCELSWRNEFVIAVGVIFGAIVTIGFFLLSAYANSIVSGCC